MINRLLGRIPSKVAGILLISALLVASTLVAAGAKASDKERIAALEGLAASQQAQNVEYNRVINILIARTEDLNNRVTHFEDQDINGHENNEKAKF